MARSPIHAINKIVAPASAYPSWHGREPVRYSCIVTRAAPRRPNYPLRIPKRLVKSDTVPAHSGILLKTEKAKNPNHQKRSRQTGQGRFPHQTPVPAHQPSRSLICPSSEGSCPLPSRGCTMQLLHTTFLRFLSSVKDLKDVPAASNYCKVH